MIYEVRTLRPGTVAEFEERYAKRLPLRKSTIQTDGVTGVLGSADIVGWNLELNGPWASFNLTNSSSVVLVGGG